MEANLSTTSRSYDNMVPNGSDFYAKEKSLGSHELLYVVMVVTSIGARQRKIYQERACTGTLIRNDMVLTLASCLLLEANQIPDPETIEVFERPNMRRLEARKVFINNNFYLADKYESKANDFALISIEKSTQTVFPQLPPRLETFKDIKNTCKMAGYGIKELVAFRNFKVYDLKNTEIHQLTGGTCKGNKMLCLHFTDIMPCEADHGTPMICDGVLYALYIPRYNRLSTRCINIYLTVFSPVYNVGDWVEKTIHCPTVYFEFLSNPLWVLLLCIVVFTIMSAIYFCVVEVLRRTFDSVDDSQTQVPLSEQEDDRDDDDSWYSVQEISQ